MEVDQERIDQLIRDSVGEVKARKFSSKQCFLKGFKKGLQALLDEIGQEKFKISQNRQDQLRRVTWEQVSVAGGAPAGTEDEVYRLGFELGWKAASEEFAKQKKGDQG